MFISCSSSRNLSTNNADDVSETTSQLEEDTTTQSETVIDNEEVTEDSTPIAQRDPGSVEYQEYKDLSNTVTNYFVLAQQYYYAAEFKTALYFINKAAEFRFDETADILALKGSIYLELDEYDLFISNWKKALQIDPDTPITLSPKVERLLKEEGLIK